MKKMFFAILFLFPLLLGCTKGIREPAANPETDFEWSVNYNNSVYITNYIGESLDVVIPEKIQKGAVTRISYGAFRDKNLTSVKLPKTLTHIESFAFSGNKLESIVIPGTVGEIKSFAFSENNLENIIISEGVSIIEYSAFSHNRISSVSFPRSLTRIDGFAFNDNKLRELTLPENLEYAGTSAFSDNEITNVTVYSENLRIAADALKNNSIVTVNLHTRAFSLIPQQVFHPTLPAYLPPGRYTLGDDEIWIVQAPDGKFYLVQSYVEELATKDPDVLEQMLYVAIAYHDVTLLRNVIALGADVSRRIYGSISRRNDTPLAHAFYIDRDTLPLNPEIIQILLEARAVPQYWMVSVSYFYASITKMLLDYGALTNPESSEYGDIPRGYKRPESPILHYFQVSGEHNRENVALLVEYGIDINTRDPQSGKTPISVALNGDSYSLDLIDSLLRYVSRPLPLEDYRSLIEFGARAARRSYRWESWWWSRDKAGMDYIDYDEFVLEAVRQGIFNLNSKDDDGKDIFDYAATIGTAGLMKGLMPYLAASGRTLLAADGTGLYIDALNAGNSAAASVLSTVMDNAFTAKDADGNEYLLEYYAYDYDTIYDSAQRIPEYSLYQTGPGGTRHISEGDFVIRYRANEFYTIKQDHSDLLLRTAKGAILNLSEIINKKREQKPDNGNPEWHNAGIFGNILFVCNNTYRTGRMESFLIDISTTVPSVYIMDAKGINFRYSPGVYAWSDFLDGTMDFVFNQDRDKAYLIKNSGEVLVFNVETDTLQLEQTVSWRDCRISGWKDGERVFIDGETLEAYNFATGTARTLGTHIETPRGLARSYYLYEDEQGRRFIVEAKTGRVYPEPDVEYYGLSFFESGYAYWDEKYRNITLCYFEAARPLDAAYPEDTKLKRKLVLSGNVIDGPLSWNVDRGKMYFQAPLLVFTVDLRTGQVNRAFNTQPSYSNNAIIIYMFPFGTDDIVYTETHDGGK